MISKYFNPYTDFGFKKLFGEEASKDLLIDFLNQLLPPQHQIAQLSFKNPENFADTSKERKAIFDVYCESQTGEPVFQKGFEIAELAHLSSEQYDAYLKSVLEHNEAKAALDTAFVDGKKEGKIEAMQSAARILKTQGIANSIIALSTGLTEQEIQNLN